MSLMYHQLLKNSANLLTPKPVATLQAAPTSPWRHKDHEGEPSFTASVWAPAAVLGGRNSIPGHARCKDHHALQEQRETVVIIIIFVDIAVAVEILNTHWRKVKVGSERLNLGLFDCFIFDKKRDCDQLITFWILFLAYIYFFLFQSFGLIFVLCLWIKNRNLPWDLRPHELE